MMALVPHQNRRLKKRSSQNSARKPSQHHRNRCFTDSWKPIRPDSSHHHHHDSQREALTPVTTATSTETTAGDMSSQGSHHHQHHHLRHSNNSNTTQPQQPQLAASTRTALPAPPPRLVQPPAYTGCSPCGSPPRLDTATTSTLVSSPTSIPLEITIVHHNNSHGPTRIRADSCRIRREALFNDSMDAYIGDQEDDDHDEHDSESSTDLDHFMTLLDLQEPVSSVVDNGVALDDDSRESPVSSHHHPLLHLVRPLHRHQQTNHHHGAAAATSLEEIELLPCWNKFHHSLTYNTQHDAVWGLTTTTLHDNDTLAAPPPPLPLQHAPITNCDCRSDEEHSRRSWPSDEECHGQGQRLVRCHSCCRDLMCSGGSVLSAKDSRVTTMEPVHALDGL
jgi:hypothetical protein